MFRRSTGNASEGTISGTTRDSFRKRREESITSATSIPSEKRSGARRGLSIPRILIVNTFIIRNGIYGGLVDCLLYKKRFELYLKINNELVELKYEPFQGSKEFFICGASCDSGDRIGKFYIDSNIYDKLQVGSKIIVNNALAYVEEFFMPLGGDLRKECHIINTN